MVRGTQQISCIGGKLWTILCFGPEKKNEWGREKHKVFLSKLIFPKTFIQVSGMKNLNMNLTD
jgi:hypothetical protein